jgi:predicted RNase H-like nuclease (RuvC/YqgF family)
MRAALSPLPTPRVSWQELEQQVTMLHGENGKLRGQVEALQAEITRTHALEERSRRSTTQAAEESRRVQLTADLQLLPKLEAPPA